MKLRVVIAQYTRALCQKLRQPHESILIKYNTTDTPNNEFILKTDALTKL